MSASKTKKRLHVCNGCGLEKMLDPNKRHWHKCNPAPFSFIVKTDKELASKIINVTKIILHR